MLIRKQEQQVKVTGNNTLVSLGCELFDTAEMYRWDNINPSETERQM